MTDLKYLEEVLPAYRAGKKIFRVNLDGKGKATKLPPFRKLVTDEKLKWPS